jgi:NADH:ubiquinone oxidoreductase subunit 6 (subunit J)
MTAEVVGFWLVGAVLVVGSLGVVLSRNLFHAAVLYLPIALVATGAIFWLLESPFLFGVQLLLYAGGVVTIVVFAIMLTERLVGASIRQSSRFVFNGAVLAAAVFVGVTGFVVQRAAPTAPPPPAGEQMVLLGRALVGPFGVALQLLAVLLVVALLGALYFARTED